MPRVRPIKPKPIKLDTVTARAVRGPHRDGSGRWYWRADNYIGEGKRETVWTGWATREESRQEVSRLLAAQDVREAARADRDARTGSIQTVTDLLELYLGAEAGRVDVWRQEERRGEEAVAKGAATVVLHSRDGLAPASYENKLLAGRHIAGDALGRIRLDRLQSDDLRDYALRAQNDLSPGSVRNYVACLRGAWGWGAKNERGYTCDPSKLTWPRVVATPVREKYTPPRHEVEAALARMDPGWARDVLKVQSILGCRISALARLPRRDVDLARGTVRLKAKRHDRVVQVPQEVIDVLRPWVEAAPDAGTIWRRSAATVKIVTNPSNNDTPSPWARACEEAGVARPTSHGIRRMVCNEWMAAGVNVAVYARVLGHSPEEALRAYSAVSRENEADAFTAAGRVRTKREDVHFAEQRHG